MKALFNHFPRNKLQPKAHYILKTDVVVTVEYCNSILQEKMKKGNLYHRHYWNNYHIFYSQHYNV